MTSSRSSKLLRILEIEGKIKRISSNSDYKKIKKYLRVINNPVGRRGIVNVGSPENMDKMIELRRNSPSLKTITSLYKMKLETYEADIGRLDQERTQLRKELFA